MPFLNSIQDLVPACGSDLIVALTPVAEIQWLRLALENDFLHLTGIGTA
jgi:hypothetical protein